MNSEVNHRSSGYFSPKKFRIPFVLTQKNDYAVWLFEVVQEIKRYYGPYEYKYFVNFLRGTSPQLHLPKHEQYRYDVAHNVVELAHHLVAAGMEKSLKGLKNAGEEPLEIFKSYHDFFCKFTRKQYCYHLLHWSSKVSWSEPLSKSDCKKVVANLFSPSEISRMKRMQAKLEKDPDFEVFNRRQWKAKNISNRILHVAEYKPGVDEKFAKRVGIELLNEVEPENQHCTYCNTSGHEDVACDEKRRVKNWRRRRRYRKNLRERRLAEQNAESDEEY